MSPLLHRAKGLLKRKDPLPTPDPFTHQPPSPSHPTSPATGSLSPYSIPSPSPKSPASPSSSKIPNTDPLPLNTDSLEGLLNTRSSQLQKLADRIEVVNEWLEMDVIVLARRIMEIKRCVELKDETERAGREAKERAMALYKENVPAASKGVVSPASYRLGVNDTSNGHNEGSSSTSPGSPSHRRLPNAESRVPQVYLKGLNLDKKSLEEVIAEDCGVRELRQRIRGMKRWRREIERTVVWQREEYARVLAAIGKPKSESEQGKEAGEEDTPEEVSPAGPSGTTRKVVQFDVEEGKGEGKGKETGKEEVKETMKEEVKETGKEEVKETGVLRDEGWGVGGQTWEKGSGRLPTQSEWEELFSEGKIGWDDKGIPRSYLGC